MKERCRFSRVPLSVSIMAALGFLLASPDAKANTIPISKDLDFSGGAGGTFSYTIGSGNTASVNGAPIGQVAGFPDTSRVLDISMGTLDLTTGMCILSCSVGKNGNSVPTFGPGGGITLWGGISALGISNGTALFSGTFTPFTAPDGHTYPAAVFNLNSHGQTSGMDAYIKVSSINPELLTYFGFSPSFTGGKGHLSELLMKLTFMTPSWNGEVESTDLFVDPALPEPPSLLLFGSALLFVAYMVRRKGSVSAGRT